MPGCCANIKHANGSVMADQGEESLLPRLHVLFFGELEVATMHAVKDSLATVASQIALSSCVGGLEVAVCQLVAQHDGSIQLQARSYQAHRVCLPVGFLSYQKCVSGSKAEGHRSSLKQDLFAKNSS